MKNSLLLSFMLLIGFSNECFSGEVLELVETKHLTRLNSLRAIWDDIKVHCQTYRFHNNEDNLERRFIDWNRGLDGEVDASARCEINPSEWNDIDAPEKLRPYFIKILEETKKFRTNHGNPKSFLWMLRNQTSENWTLKFHRDDNVSNAQPVTAILYDTEDVLRGGDLIFATEDGDGCPVDTPSLYPDDDWLGDEPSVEEVKGSLRHLITYSPKTGDLVTFANMNLFHAVNAFELRPQGSRMLLTLFFVGDNADIGR